jgi:protocatechuate 3,4-dioxygenase beta subunit
VDEDAGTATGDARLTRAAALRIASASALVAVGLHPERALAVVRRGTTPACADGDETPPILAGPYFKPHSPERLSLREPAVTGVPLTLAGRVYDERCRPASRTLLDFWQCDRQGRYDRKGFRLRGHQYTDAEGRYSLRTIVPSHYERRTPHIHVRVQAPRGPVLTTQLFFPETLRAYGLDVGRLNAADRFFDSRCLVGLGARRPDGYNARFDFVIART